jgi:hypothetical protein
MKTITIIILAGAVILIPFRNRITKESMTKLAHDPSTITRLVYVGIALLWLYIAQNAERIHLPPKLYAAFPSGVLLLYAIFPLRTIWLLIATTFLTGWCLHMYQSVQFQIAHLGVKIEMLGLVMMDVQYVLMLVIGLAFLYATGPYLMKRHRMTKKAS